MATSSSSPSMPQPEKGSNDGLAASNGKTPKIIGLYGLPASGKSTLMDKLEKHFGTEHFKYFEGSKVINELVHGGLAAFKGMDEQEQDDCRQRAIKYIAQTCFNESKVGIVTGHFKLWSHKTKTTFSVYTKADLATFTHILYLDVPIETIKDQAFHDETRPERDNLGDVELTEWQQSEKEDLRRLCRNHGILFSLVQPSSLDKIKILLEDFKQRDEKRNTWSAIRKLDETGLAQKTHLETILIIDGDKTLAAEDTGTMFWKMASKLKTVQAHPDTLSNLFDSPLKYSYTAFRQATLLYEETTDEDQFHDLCKDVASNIAMYADFVSLLQLVSTQEHIGAVVVTSGLRQVWEMVLELKGLSGMVKVIGGTRISDEFVVTGAVKAALVTHLQKEYKMKVWAFGDSPLDIEMLKAADRAIVVTSNKDTRSKSIEAELRNAISNNSLEALQVLLPKDTPMRLDTTLLPTVDITQTDFIDLLLGAKLTNVSFEYHGAQNKTASKLLATSMRDSAVAGPALRKSYQNAGWYLATEYLTTMIGLEPRLIRHVQGQFVEGYQLLHEQQTTIVALMRGGEPMAYGVNDAFPSAMFVHAKPPEELRFHHIEGQLTIILVDSIINTGGSITAFVRRIRKLHATIRIVIVATVVQERLLDKNNAESLHKQLGKFANIQLVALRTSPTKFTGKGSTDTGHRLFNTTHLD